MRRRPAVLAALTAAALAAGAAPTAAAAPGSETDRLVQQWYTDFLGRPAGQTDEESGRGYWVDQIDGGEDPRRILDALLSSAEYADRTVDAYYETHLGRDATNDTGADAFEAEIRADTEPEWVEQTILASPEYEQRTGDRRIEQWYRVVLGRTGSSVVSESERAYWEGRADAIGSLATLRELWYSEEAVENRIRQAYEDLLGRAGEQVSGGEIDYWYDQAYNSRLGLQVEFALSEGYLSAGS